MKNLIFTYLLATLSVTAHSAALTGAQANCPDQDKLRDQVVSEVSQARDKNKISPDAELVLLSALYYSKTSLFDVFVADELSEEEKNDFACFAIELDLVRVQDVLSEFSNK